MSQIEKITKEFSVIKKALNAEGYSLSKEFSRPIWKISPGYPNSHLVHALEWKVEGGSAEGEKLRAIVKGALSLSVRTEEQRIKQIKPYAVMRLDDGMQRSVMQRHRKRADADDYARALKRLMPSVVFEVVYDP